jgi:hypothetical protein
MNAQIPGVHSDPEILGGTPVFVGTRVPVRALQARFLLGVASAVGILLLWSPPSSDGQVRNLAALACRHDDSGGQQDRSRRDQAVALARAIHSAEGILAQQTRRYQPLAQLANLPPVPDGFRLRLFTDGDGYVFSLKDERDPCHYGIFSDEAGRLYEASPQIPLIAS